MLAACPIMLMNMATHMLGMLKALRKSASNVVGSPGSGRRRSVTRKTVNKVEMKTRMLDAVSDPRTPKMAARVPPMTGPMMVPAADAVCTDATYRAEYWGGVLVPTSAMDMGINPVKAPLRSRSTATCHGAVARLVRKYRRLRAKPARTAIGLRPYLSASLPHTGTMKMAVTKWALRAMPAHVLRPSSTPISARNRGRNGITCVQLAETRKTATQITYRFFR